MHVIILTTCLAVLILYRIMTDRQTDRQTHRLLRKSFLCICLGLYVTSDSHCSYCSLQRWRIITLPICCPWRILIGFDCSKFSGCIVCVFCLSGIANNLQFLSWFREHAVVGGEREPGLGGYYLLGLASISQGARTPESRAGYASGCLEIYVNIIMSNAPAPLMCMTQKRSGSITTDGDSPKGSVFSRPYSPNGRAMFLRATAYML